MERERSLLAMAPPKRKKVLFTSSMSLSLLLVLIGQSRVMFSVVELII
jgi:hypothetical protein